MSATTDNDLKSEAEIENEEKPKLTPYLPLIITMKVFGMWATKIKCRDDSYFRYRCLLCFERLRAIVTIVLLIFSSLIRLINLLASPPFNYFKIIVIASTILKVLIFVIDYWLMIHQKHEIKKILSESLAFFRERVFLRRFMTLWSWSFSALFILTPFIYRMSNPVFDCVTWPYTDDDYILPKNIKLCQTKWVLFYLTKSICFLPLALYFCVVLSFMLKMNRLLRMISNNNGHLDRRQRVWKVYDEYFGLCNLVQKTNHAFAWIVAVWYSEMIIQITLIVTMCIRFVKHEHYTIYEAVDFGIYASIYIIMLVVITLVAAEVPDKGELVRGKLCSEIKELEMISDTASDSQAKIMYFQTDINFSKCHLRGDHFFDLRKNMLMFAFGVIFSHVLIIQRIIGD